jgi:hypothetical protein
MPTRSTICSYRMNWEAEMNKPIRVKNGGGFFTMREVLAAARSSGLADKVVEALLDECVAVDLDGTLAKDSGWKGPEHIGEPVKPMLDLVNKLLDDGEDVVIFTARVHDGEKSTKEHIKQWLKDHDLPDLEITNEKRPDMEKFYDDKAVAVEKNKGVSESEEAGAWFVSYRPQRGGGTKLAVAMAEGKARPHVLTKEIRKALESITGRRMSWSNDDIMITGYADVAKVNAARAKREITCIILHLDGTVTIEREGTLGESLLLESPKIKTMEKNKVDLDPEERKQVMKAKAVWPFGKNGADSPAVHKAVVDGKTWYWSSTHRLCHVDKTLAAAIKNFFKIVEPSG